MQQHGPPARPQQNGAVDSDDPDSQDESESIPAVGSGVDGSTMTSPLKGVGLGGENSISVSEVGSRLKETLLRLYPDEYSTQQPIAFQSNVRILEGTVAQKCCVFMAGIVFSIRKGLVD